MQTRLFIAFLLMINVYANAQIPGFVPSNGLLVWYPFNGNFNNQSGSNVDHFTNVNNVTFTTDRNGVANSSANFSGSSQYLNLPTASFSFSNTGEFSMFYYIRRDDATMANVVSIYSGSNFNNAFQWASASAVFGCQKTGGTWTWSGVQTANATWEFIAFTYKDGAMKIYRNGSLYSTATYPKAGVTMAARLILGSNGISQYWKGQIDDLAIYSRELTAAEILGIYNQCNSTTQGGNISGPASVCVGTNSSSLSLSGHNGTVSKWQTSNDNSSWSDVASSSNLTTLTVSNISTVKYYRAVVSRTNCPTANSGVFTLNTSVKKWNGGSNNQFSNSSNWCGGIPSTTEIFEIQKVAILPQLTDNRTFGGIILNGNLDLNGQNITINGPISGTGGFVSNSNSTIILGNLVNTDSLKFADIDPVIKTLQLNSNVGLKLNKKLIIRDSLILNNGKLVLGNNHVSAKNIVSASNNNYVQTNGTGKLFFSVNNTNKFIPVGNQYYNPINISIQSGIDSFGVNVADQIYESGTSGSLISNGCVQATWDLHRVIGNGSQVNLSFNWSQLQEQIGFNRNDCFVSHFNSLSQKWEKLDSSNKAASGLAPMYSISYNNYKGSFSPFGIGSVNSVLPVDLLYFKANDQAKNHYLTWETAKEENISHFEIEQLIDNGNFISIAKINSNGINSSGARYSKLINVYHSGTYYYRLAIVDLDGSKSYSKIVKINCSNQKSTYLFPNPFNDELNVQLIGNRGDRVVVSVFNILGIKVDVQSFEMNFDEEQRQLRTSMLPKGLYTVVIDINGKIISQKLKKD